MDIGSAIKEFRKKRGLTQKDLAQKSGLSANALCTLERNLSFPTKETIEKICTALGIPVSFLLFFAITDEDVPEDKRVAFKALQGPLKTVLSPEENNDK